MPSFFERIGQAARILLGREQRSVPMPDYSWCSGYGRPALFKHKESLQAYGDNVWLYSAVNSIAFELARTEFKLRTVSQKGEIKYVQKHVALDTMNLPQPIEGGKSMLTKMLLKMITGMHMLLNGEAFWLLDNRLKINGA